MGKSGKGIERFIKTGVDCVVPRNVFEVDRVLDESINITQVLDGELEIVGGSFRFPFDPWTGSVLDVVVVDAMVVYLR